MTSISIQLSTDNDAFDEDFPAGEASAVLCRITQKLRTDGINPGRSYPLRDTNGNRVGWCHITDDEADAGADYLQSASALVQQIARMSLVEECAGGDLGNDAAMDGLINRARALLSGGEG